MNSIFFPEQELACSSVDLKQYQQRYTKCLTNTALAQKELRLSTIKKTFEEQNFFY